MMERPNIESKVRGKFFNLLKGATTSDVRNGVQDLSSYLKVTRDNEKFFDRKEQGELVEHYRNILVNVFSKIMPKNWKPKLYASLLLSGEDFDIGDHIILAVQDAIFIMNCQVQRSKNEAEWKEYHEEMMYTGWSNWKNIKNKNLYMFSFLFMINGAKGEELGWPIKEVNYYLEQGKKQQAINIIVAFNLLKIFENKINQNEFNELMAVGKIAIKRISNLEVTGGDTHNIKDKFLIVDTHENLNDKEKTLPTKLNGSDYNMPSNQVLNNEEFSSRNRSLTKIDIPVLMLKNFVTTKAEQSGRLLESIREASGSPGKDKKVKAQEEEEEENRKRLEETHKKSKILNELKMENMVRRDPFSIVAKYVFQNYGWEFSEDLLSDKKQLVEELAIRLIRTKNFEVCAAIGKRSHIPLNRLFKKDIPQDHVENAIEILNSKHIVNNRVLDYNEFGPLEPHLDSSWEESPPDPNITSFITSEDFNFKRKQILIMEEDGFKILIDGIIESAQTEIGTSKLQVSIEIFKTLQISKTQSSVISLICILYKNKIYILDILDPKLPPKIGSKLNNFLICSQIELITFNAKKLIRNLSKIFDFKTKISLKNFHSIQDFYAKGESRENYNERHYFNKPESNKNNRGVGISPKENNHVVNTVQMSFTEIVEQEYKGKRLCSKTPCSNWRVRPIREYQMHYIAVVLLVYREITDSILTRLRLIINPDLRDDAESKLIKLLF